MKEILQEMWKDVLELDELPGLDESFFDLGGNSFSAAKIISILEEKYGKALDVVDFYNHESINEIESFLNEKNN